MKREEFKNIIKDVNEAKTKSIYDVEEVCTSFYGASPQVIRDNMNIDKHRWYEISTTVYKIGEWFIGIRGASKLYSEDSSWEDICVTTIAFEMKEVLSVTYERKVE